MFNEVPEAVLVSEQHAGQVADAVAEEKVRLLREHGRPLWLRQGQTKNGSVVFAVSKKAPGNSRTFSVGTQQSPWEYYA